MNHNGQPKKGEIGPVFPPDSRAVVFLGKLGSTQTVEIMDIQPITAPDGAIGIPLSELSELPAGNEERVLWVRPQDARTDLGAEATQENRLSLLDGKVVMDFDRQELIVDDEPVPIAPRALAVLQVLAEKKNRIVHKDELVHRLWGGWTSTTSVQVHIGYARKSLGEYKSLIQNRHGFGYLLDEEGYERNTARERKARQAPS